MEGLANMRDDYFDRMELASDAIIHRLNRWPAGGQATGLVLGDADDRFGSLGDIGRVRLQCPLPSGLCYAGSSLKWFAISKGRHNLLDEEGE